MNYQGYNQWAKDAKDYPSFLFLTNYQPSKKEDKIKDIKEALSRTQGAGKSYKILQENLISATKFLTTTQILAAKNQLVAKVRF